MANLNREPEERGRGGGACGWIGFLRWGREARGVYKWVGSDFF